MELEQLREALLSRYSHILSSADAMVSPEKIVEDIVTYYENIIACMPGNVYWLDKKGVTLGANDNVLTMFGMKDLSAFKGLTFEEMGKLGKWSNKAISSFKKDTLDVIASGKAKINIEEPPIPDASGPLVHFLSSRVPLYNKSGEIVGVVGISVDITDRKRLEQVLVEAKERAETANQAKSDFLSMISHELRIPLTGILGMSRLLELESLSAGQHSRVRDILSASEHLLSLVNDLLDMSKLEAGKMELHLAPVDLRGVLEEAVAILTAPAKAKGLDLLINYDEDVPRMLMADARALRQIIINLAGNAIKFTEHGCVSIHVRCLKKIKQRAQLELSVEDTGVGISKDKLKLVFERFQQINDSVYTRQQGGTGLGLTISKAYVELMGGSIEVNSKLGKGTVFACQIPFNLPNKSMLTSPWEQYKSNVKIMIVDDTLRGKVLAKHIGTAYARVVKSKEILSMLAATHKDKQCCDVVLIDDQLPRQQAKKLAQKINKQFVADCPMLLLLSVAGDLPTKEAAQKAGFFDILTKPIQPTDLLINLTAAWEKWIDKKSVLGLKNKKRGKKRRRILLVEDEPIVQQVHRDMLELLHCDVDTADDGKQALAMYNNGYDMIFMDVGLPRMSGLDVTAEIRKKENGKHIPIIAMTAFASETDKEKFLKIGVNDVATKPIDLPDLQKLLDQWVR